TRRVRMKTSDRHGLRGWRFAPMLERAPQRRARIARLQSFRTTRTPTLRAALRLPRAIARTARARIRRAMMHRKRREPAQYRDTDSRAAKIGASRRARERRRRGAAFHRRASAAAKRR